MNQSILRDGVERVGFLTEARAFLKVAETLDGRSKEEACAIMAAVSASLGFYDQAKTFADLAAHYRDQEAASLAREELANDHARLLGRQEP